MAAPDGKYAGVIVVNFRKDNQVRLGEPCPYFQQIPLIESTFFVIETASGKVAAHRDEKEKQQLSNRKRAKLDKHVIHGLCVQQDLATEI